MKVIQCTACNKVIGSSFTPPKKELLRMIEENGKASNKAGMFAMVLAPLIPMLPDDAGDHLDFVVRYYCPNCTAEIALRALEKTDDGTKHAIARDILARLGWVGPGTGDGDATAGNAAGSDGEQASGDGSGVTGGASGGSGAAAGAQS